MHYYLRKVLLLFVTSFKQSIYNYIPQRKHIYILTCILSAIIYVQINASNFIIIIIIITTITIINIILVPQTSHVSRCRCSFAAIVWSQHMVHLMVFPNLNIFYFHITTFPNNCAVPSKAAVQTYCMSSFPRMLLRYFLNITRDGSS